MSTSGKRRRPDHSQRVLKFSMCALLIGALIKLDVVAVAQQMSTLLNSNLEQSAGAPQSKRASNTQNGGPVALPDDFARFRLGPGDTMEMEVFGIPELTQTLHIDKDGVTVVPLIGAVQVGGLTLREAEQAIVKALAANEMVNSPQVSLTVTQFSPQGVVLSGEVQNPGEYRLLEPRSLSRVLADAGGVTSASAGQIELHHRGTDGQDHVQSIPYLHGPGIGCYGGGDRLSGDTIFVARAGVVYVLGAVNRPGAYLMVDNGTLNLPQAVGLAQGATVIASAKTVVVVRDVGGQTMNYPLRPDQMSRGKIPQFALNDGDMVFVPTSSVKSALISYSAIFSAATNASIVAGITR